MRFPNQITTSCQAMGRRTRHLRKGAALVEFAFVGSVTLLLLIGFAILAAGVFRYQQVAYLAREGARHASTHGAQYRADHRLPVGNPSTWTQEIRDQSVLPHSTALSPGKLTVDAAWSAGDNRANAADSTTEFTTTISNRVTVTVVYAWSPEAFLAGPITLRSTATMPMAY
jgi:Flp pilus assembly protein TadG